MQKVECFAAIGDIHGGELGDADRAVDAFLNVLSIDADNVARSTR